MAQGRPQSPLVTLALLGAPTPPGSENLVLPQSQPHVCMCIYVFVTFLWICLCVFVNQSPDVKASGREQWLIPAPLGVEVTAFKALSLGGAMG